MAFRISFAPDPNVRRRQYRAIESSVHGIAVDIGLTADPIIAHRIEASLRYDPATPIPLPDTQPGAGGRLATGYTGDGGRRGPVP